MKVGDGLLSYIQENNHSFALTVEPFVDEGLLDLIFRTVEINGFNRLKVFERISGLRINRSCSHFALAKQTLNTTNIAQALNLPAATIERLVYRKSRKCVMFFGTEISPNYLAATRRVSPTFIKQYGYQPASWALRFFSFDPKTRETLLSRCPECGYDLTYRVSLGVAYCSHCYADLRAFPQEVVDISDEPALELVTSLVQCSDEEFRSIPLPDVLRRFTRGEILSIIVATGKLLDYQLKGGVQEKITTRTEDYNISAVSLITASRSVLDWDSRFFDMANSLRDIKTHLRNSGDHPLTLCVPVSFKTLRQFLAGELRLGGPSGGYQRLVFSTDKHTKKEVAYSFPAPVTKHVAEIGLPPTEVLTLYRNGIIECPDRKLRHSLNAPGNAPKLDLGALVQRSIPGRIGSPVTDLVISAKPSRHPWAAVFAAIIRGEIGVSINSYKTGRLFKNMCSTDHKGITDICLSTDPEVDGETPVGNAKDIGFYLGMAYETVNALWIAGLLPHKDIKFRDIWSFQDSFMTSGELRARAVLNGRRFDSRTLWKYLESLSYRRAIPTAGILKRQDGERFLSCFLGDGASG